LYQDFDDASQRDTTHIRADSEYETGLSTLTAPDFVCTTSARTSVLGSTLLVSTPNK
jgi:hypothetical protein